MTFFKIPTGVCVVQAVFSIAALAALTACTRTADQSPSVSREEFIREGKVWPLTVPDGLVGCAPNKTDRHADAIWFKAPDGKLYGLNSYAKEEMGFSDLEPIWAEDVQRSQELQTAFPGQPLPVRNRLPLSDLNARAAQTCFSAKIE